MGDAICVGCGEKLGPGEGRELVYSAGRAIPDERGMAHANERCCDEGYLELRRRLDLKLFPFAVFTVRGALTPIVCLRARVKEQQLPRRDFAPLQLTYELSDSADRTAYFLWADEIDKIERIGTAEARTAGELIQ